MQVETKSMLSENENPTQDADSAPIADPPAPQPPPFTFPPNPADTTPPPDLRAFIGDVFREDSLTYDERLCRWRKKFDPRTNFEEFLLQLCVTQSFQIEHIQQARQEQLRSSVERIERDQFLEVHELGKQLFFDPCGPTPMYGLASAMRSSKRTSWNGLAVDPLDPVPLVTKLESSGAGCRWLRDRWSELRDRLAPGYFWQSQDRLKCIRMLRRQPIDSAEDRTIAEIHAATFAIHPGGRLGWYDLLGEMGKRDLERFLNRVNERFTDLIDTFYHAKARQILIDLVDRQIERLNELVAQHEKNPRDRAERTVARLRVDRTPEGERLSRYEAKCTAEFRRTFDMYRKIRGIRNKKSDMLSTDDPAAPDFIPDDSIAPLGEQKERFAPTIESNGSPAEQSSSPAPSNPAPRPPASSLQSPPQADPLHGLSKREKRRLRRESNQPGIEPRQAERPDQMRSRHGPTNESIRSLLANTPGAADYLKSFLPGSH
jgi:hypothetical protein